MYGGLQELDLLRTRAALKKSFNFLVHLTRFYANIDPLVVAVDLRSWMTSAVLLWHTHIFLGMNFGLKRAFPNRKPQMSLRTKHLKIFSRLNNSPWFQASIKLKRV
jgi:hypothetical protein